MITIHRDGTNYGPYDEDQLKDFINSGNITLDDMAWSDEHSEWAPLRKFVQGGSIPPPPPAVSVKSAKPKKKTSSFLVFVILLVLFFVILGVAGSIQSNSVSEPAPEWHLRYRQAEALIKKGLKCPSTAKFSDYLSDQHTGAKHLGKDVWDCFGYVDSQNAFGAMIRNQWELILDVKIPKILYVKIGSDKSGDYKAAFEAAGATPD